jgi:hypothetical protein
MNTSNSIAPTRVHRGLLIAAVAMMLSACIMPGTPLPSRALEVALGPAGTDAVGVATEIEPLLRQRGFVDRGKDGYDLINNTELTRRYTLAGRTHIAIAMDSSTAVLVRVTANSEHFTPEAESVYAEIRHHLESKWPDAVREVP